MKKELHQRIPIRKEELSPVTVVLQSQTKMEIIKLLMNNPHPTGMYFNEICQAIGVSKSALHRHLIELVEAGIVNGEIGRASSSRRLVMLHSINKKYLDAFRKLEI